MSTVPGIQFRAVYIHVAPKDSMYFTQDSFAMISDQCHSSRDGIIILGDMNARIPSLEEFACKELVTHQIQMPVKMQMAKILYQYLNLTIWYH